MQHRLILAPVRRIAIVCVRNCYGGAERATLLWARRMKSLGYAIVWICDKEFLADCRRGFAADDGIELRSVPEDDVNARSAALAEILDEMKIDTCLLPDHWREYVFSDLQVAKKVGVRTVIAEHNMYFFPIDEGRYEMLDRRRRLYPLADAITALSPQNVAWWRALGLRNVVCMPNYATFRPVELEKLAPKGRLKLLFCGRICERKGAAEAARVVRHLCDLGVDAELTFLGRFETPNYERTMRGLVQELAVTPNIVFAGEQSDVRSYFAETAFLLLPSRIEGMPMVIDEARSYGVPSVIFDMPYVDGMDEEHGVLSVPFGEVEAMARMIRDVAADEKRFLRVSRAARATAESFDADAIDDRWKRLFGQLEAGDTTIDPQCREIDDSTMLKMTMSVLCALSPRKPGADGDVAMLKVALDELKRSFSWRIGRFLTSPVRLLKRLAGAKS